MTAFNESQHIITDIKGSMISVKTKEGKEFTRDAAPFRRWFGCQEQRDPNVSVPVDSTGQLQVQEEQSSLPLRAPVIKETDLRRSTRIKQPPDFYRPVNCNTKFLKQRGDVAYEAFILFPYLNFNSISPGLMLTSSRNISASIFLILHNLSRLIDFIILPNSVFE